jgi:hypothetical protein
LPRLAYDPAVTPSDFARRNSVASRSPMELQNG